MIRVKIDIHAAEILRKRWIASSARLGRETKGAAHRWPADCDNSAGSESNCFRANSVFAFNSFHNPRHREENSIVSPTSKGQAAKSQHHFFGLHRCVRSNRVWCQCQDRSNIFACAIQQQMRFTMRVSTRVATFPLAHGFTFSSFSVAGSSSKTTTGQLSPSAVSR